MMHLMPTAWRVLTGAVLVVALTSPAVAAAPRDYDVAGGHYYEQGAPEGGGFVVCDDEAAPLWGELRRLGGIRALGYPTSGRYACDGAVCQAFEHAVLKWAPGAKEVELLSVFDWLHHDGRDAWLDEVWGVPAWERDPAAERPKSKDKKKEERARKEAEAAAFAILDDNPSLKSAYWRHGAMTPTVYGLPRAYRMSDGLAVLRTQRAVLVQRVNSPGQIWHLPAGRVFQDAGLIPSEALAPVEAPEPSDANPPTRLAVPELGIDAAVVSMDMGQDGSLPTPDSSKLVAWYSYGARLGEGGNAVLAGHVDWNREIGVFWRLSEAQPGQTITLSGEKGRAYDYRIEWARDYPAESLAALAALRPEGGVATVTLFTCSGRFDVAKRAYEDRRVVRAVLVGQRD